MMIIMWEVVLDQGDLGGVRVIDVDNVRHGVVGVGRLCLVRMRLPMMMLPMVRLPIR